VKNVDDELYVNIIRFLAVDAVEHAHAFLRYLILTVSEEAF